MTNTPALFPYQITGAMAAAQAGRFLIADEMGLGKSAQAIHASDILKSHDILVICPASVRINWMREFRKFSSREQKKLAIYSYEGATAHAESLSKNHWDLVILDEAHYLKNPKAKRSKAIYETILKGDVENVIALTGTPMPNNPVELWPIMLHLFPDSLRPTPGDETSGAPLRYWGFVNKFCRMHNNGFRLQITGGKNLEELKKRLFPHYVRRKKADVLEELPPMLFGEVALMNVAETSKIEKMLDEDKSARRRIETAIDLDKLESEATHFVTLRRLIGKAKVGPVIEFLKEEFEGGLEKIVLFAYHREVIAELIVGLKKFHPVSVIGGMSDEAKQAGIDSFQNHPETQVFIGQFQAAGEGVNLTAASSVLFVESSWTPKDMAQAAGRCHRIGQKNSVLVRFATLVGSIDENIQRALRRKTATIKQVF